MGIMAPIVLGYWDIRGLAQPIRMLLEYAGADWKDEQYSCGPAPDYDKTCWFGIKDTLGFDYPNLPYLIDGHIKITQSNAILRYLGRKFEFDEMKEGFLKNLPGTLEKFSNYLGDRKFFAADYVTFPDFHMYEMLYSHRLLAPELVNK